VVGICVFVAQCRVGAPASYCVCDALVESVDGGSTVDCTLIAEFVLERHEKAPANREGTRTAALDSNRADAVGCGSMACYVGAIVAG
jgi:hypothetical protein